MTIAPSYGAASMTETRVPLADAGGIGMRPSRRLLFVWLGWFNVALGVFGALIPLVPTTVFLLIAAWCFTRSSPRFADWLYAHRHFGPALRRWRDERVVPLRAKLLATLSMATSVALVHGCYPEMVAGKWAVTAICLAVVSFLLSRPHVSRAAEAAATPAE